MRYTPVNEEVSYLVPIKEAESIAAIALREIDGELITPEVCEWAITEAMRGVSLLTIRTQALEAQAIAMSQRVDKVETKLQNHQEEIAMLKAGQFAQDKITTFLQGQTQQAQSLAIDSAKDKGNKHLWVHDPTGMLIGIAIVLILVSMVMASFKGVAVVQESPRQNQEQRR
jgi:hypothetical protein